MEDDNISLSTFRKLSSISAFRAQLPSTPTSTQDTIWNQIINEYEDNRAEYFKQKKLLELPILVVNEDVEYLRNHVLPELYPALENTLMKAIQWNCLQWQKCYFNGIDNISEFLWNSNKKHPERIEDWKRKFEMPWVIDLLKERPRPIFPLSWLWSEDYAVLVIQKCYRAYKDLKGRDDILELRNFWKALAEDNKRDEETRIERENELKMILLAEKKARELARDELAHSIELARQARKEARKLQQLAEDEFKSRRIIEMRLALAERRQRRANRIVIESKKPSEQTENTDNITENVDEDILSNITTCG